MHTDLYVLHLDCNFHSHALQDYLIVRLHIEMDLRVQIAFRLNGMQYVKKYVCTANICYLEFWDWIHCS